MGARSGTRLHVVGRERAQVRREALPEPGARREAAGAEHVGEQQRVQRGRAGKDSVCNCLREAALAQAQVRGRKNSFGDHEALVVEAQHLRWRMQLKENSSRVGFALCTAGALCLAMPPSPLVAPTPHTNTV